MIEFFICQCLILSDQRAHPGQIKLELRYCHNEENLGNIITITKTIRKQTNIKKIVSQLMKMNQTQVKTKKEPSKQIELQFVRLKILKF